MNFPVPMRVKPAATLNAPPILWNRENHTASDGLVDVQPETQTEVAGASVKLTGFTDLVPGTYYFLQHGTDISFSADL